MANDNGSWFQRFLRGEVGWKTIGAALALTVLVLLQHFQLITPEQFEQYTKLAEALGLVGLRDSISKLPK